MSTPAVITSSVQRIRAAVEWRAAALQSRLLEVSRDGVTNHLRCRAELGMALPALDTMQNYERLKFLHDCIVRFAPQGGVALEIGCYKCTSTVFIAHACAKAHVEKIFAIDLFTGTPSWGTSVDYMSEAKRKLAAYDLTDRVTLIRSNSLDYPWERPVAALHIDADHAYEAVRADILKFTPFLMQDGIVVFDDYDPDHAGVTKAVHEWLAADHRFGVVAANYQGHEFGSLCVRRLSV